QAISLSSIPFRSGTHRWSEGPARERSRKRNALFPASVPGGRHTEGSLVLYTAREEPKPGEVVFVSGASAAEPPCQMLPGFQQQAERLGSSEGPHAEADLVTAFLPCGRWREVAERVVGVAHAERAQPRI